MCGIVGYNGNAKATPILIDGLLSLEYRGYDSAGIAVLNKANIDVFKKQGRVNNLQNLLKDKKIDGTIGIAHTRWATHGVPSDTNAHPHLDNSKEFAVVHNGIIENYLELKEFLKNKGYTFLSETDTEVIPNLIHYYYHNGKKSVLEAVSKVIKSLKGSYAIEVITPFEPDKIIVARNESPIVIGKGKNEFYIASDIQALISKTNEFYFINDKEIGVIYKDKAEFYDIDLNKVNLELKNVEWAASSCDKDGYADYMLKEIHEQPIAIRETIGTSLSSDKIILPLGNIDFSKFNKIYIVACGTAMHAGLATRYIFEKFTGIETCVDMASEFRYRDPLIDENTLCIFVSQSGETADTIAALKLCQKRKSTSISIVNIIGSSLTRISDYTLYTHAGPEIAVASTKAYTCQVTLLAILALYISEKLGKSDLAISNLKKEILSLPSKVEDTLKIVDEPIKKIAKETYMKKDMFFVGRISDYTVAMEGSLKLKEISYIHSEAYTAGELKHGPIALMEKGVTVVGIATNKDIASKTISNLEEMISRNASVVLITNQDIGDFTPSEVVRIPECNYLLSPVISVVPLQLLAYYIAKNKNLDVDKPRNLAKSVTVE